MYMRRMGLGSAMSGVIADPHACHCHGHKLCATLHPLVACTLLRRWQATHLLRVKVLCMVQS